MPSVADLLIEGLAEAGARRLFVVLRGDSTAALLRSATARGLPAVPVHSEFAACIMAAVEGELADAPGAVAVESAAAALAGLAHARLDRAPMILVTEPAAVPSGLDPAPAGGAAAKQRLLVDPDSASRRVAHAARLAMTEPRGPVHLELPRDVAGRTAVAEMASARPPGTSTSDVAALDATAALIEAASRPLLVAGLGCRREDAGWVRALAEALPAPVLTTLKGKGTMPEPHPLAFGVLGGAPEAPLVHRADLVVAIGVDAAELGRTPWPYAAKVIHVSRAAHSGDGYPAAVEVVGEPGLILEELAPRLRGRARADWDVAELAQAKRAGAARLAAGSGLTPYRIAQIARELTPGGTIAAIEGSPAMLPVALGWPAVAPGECLVPIALGTAGFALPAAIAARLADSERRVLCFTEPGGLLRVLGELETAARLALPIVVLVLGAGESVAAIGPAAGGLGLSVHAATDEGSMRRAITAGIESAAPTLIFIENTPIRGDA